MKAHPIRFGIATGQQGYEWPQLKHLWETADRAGYDSLWTGDHLYAIFGEPTRPNFEGWATLAALSQCTTRAKIGSLVNCNGFRNPCLTAKMAVTLDHTSAARFILGIGAGWFEPEHRSLGFEFKPTAERLGALDEACRIIKAMLAEGQTTLRGKYYQVTDATCSPRPLQEPRPPLMIAGQGERLLLRIVAQHAELWNAYGSVEHMQHLIDVMRRHGDRMGRDVDQIEKTIAIPFCYRASREQEKAAIQFAAALGRRSPDEARRQMIIGGPDECLDTVERYARCDVTHFILIAARSFEPEELSRFADEVIAAVRTRGR